jgi:serine protease Do
VWAVVGLRQNSGQMQISAPVQPGNSGGPVLDATGNVVGVVVSKLNTLGVASVTGDIAQNVNFAIKASVAKNFLDANNVPTISTISSQPVSNPDLADRAKAFTAFVTCRG